MPGWSTQKTTFSSSPLAPWRKGVVLTNVPSANWFARSYGSEGTLKLPGFVTDPWAPGLNALLVVPSGTLTEMFIVVCDPKVIAGRRKYSVVELRPERTKVMELELLPVGLARRFPSESSRSSR